jgi:hypothetical protein
VGIIGSDRGFLLLANVWKFCIYWELSREALCVDDISLVLGDIQKFFLVSLPALSLGQQFCPLEVVKDHNGQPTSMKVDDWWANRIGYLCPAGFFLALFGWLVDLRLTLLVCWTSAIIIVVDNYFCCSSIAFLPYVGLSFRSASSCNRIGHLLTSCHLLSSLTAAGYSQCSAS